MSFNNNHFDGGLSEGVVVDVVCQHKEWVVRVYGIYWHARTPTEASFKPGDSIRIVGRQGTKLLIEPE